jgi:hypothetical protein
MDNDDLKKLAGRALEIAHDDLLNKGAVCPTFITRGPDGGFEVMRFEDRAAQLFNDGSAKDLLFDAMRELVKERGLTAVIFVNEAWVGKQTAKGRAIGQKEFNRRTRERGFETALRDGLVERWEAIMITIQTPAGVLIVQQPFTRDYAAKTVDFGERIESEAAPGEFRGRQKMYGDLSEENLS